MNEQQYFFDIFEEIWPKSSNGLETIDLKDELEKFECNSINDALNLHDGNQTKAAKSLKLGRTCLIAKMKKYDLL